MRCAWLSLGLMFGIATGSAVAAADQQTVAVCAPFDQLALDRLPTKWESADGVDFQEAWKQWAHDQDGSPWPISDEPLPQFRLVTNFGFVPHGPVSQEVRGQKLDGVWHMTARSGRFGQRQRKWLWTKWKSVAVSHEAAAKIDALLGGQCLWQSPRFLDNELPLVTGGRAPSFDGPVSFFDIRADHRQWGGIQVSWRLGPPGKLRAAILAAAFGEPEYTDADVRSAGIVLKDGEDSR